MTDGLFLRLLQDDPSLDGVGCVIFDELHERGLETDLAFALVRESQAALREDLRVIAMSATLDPGPVSERLGGAPLVESAGRMFPVETRYLDREAGRPHRGHGRERGTQRARRRRAAAPWSSCRASARSVASRSACKDSPPTSTWRRCTATCRRPSRTAPSRRRPPGRRKVVLATSIAETSLTIEGVRLVIDCGLMRVPRFSPRSGMTRLETVRVSQASADQRRGRAGRLEPGICYRLWTEEAQRGLLPFTPPEILDADLAPLALELAAWGVADAAHPALADAAAAPRRSPRRANCCSISARSIRPARSRRTAAPWRGSASIRGSPIW